MEHCSLCDLRLQAKELPCESICVMTFDCVQCPLKNSKKRKYWNTLMIQICCKRVLIEWMHCLKFFPVALLFLTHLSTRGRHTPHLIACLHTGCSSCLLPVVAVLLIKLQQPWALQGDGMVPRFCFAFECLILQFFSTFSWFIVTLSWVLIALLRWSFFAVHFATVFRNRWKEEEMESILVLWFVCPLLNNSNVLVCCFWNCSTLSKTVYSQNLCFHHTSDVADLNVYEDCVMKKYIFPFLSCTLVLL